MQRHFQPELMDGQGLDHALLADDLEKLETLNRLFGGRSVIQRYIPALLREVPDGATLTAIDLGSGAGDLCRALVEECRRGGRKCRVWSLDAHPQIQAYARDRCAPGYPEIRFLQGDARQVPLRDESVDLALCTLALHHFTDGDAVRVLAEMRRVARRIAFVSDLRRSRTAYLAVWAATRVTTNEMTRHDGPVSVQRAFTRRELEGLARRAGWANTRFQPEPWFRMSLVERKEGAW